MVALTGHLQPAPYPYGLLCMRLLGKLGGMNRSFVREMVGYRGDDQCRQQNNLSLYCEWQQPAGAAEDGEDSFLLPFPLTRALEVLISVGNAPIVVAGDEGNDAVSVNDTSELCLGEKFTELPNIDPLSFDLNVYCVETMAATKKSQARSAFNVLRAALASVLDINDAACETDKGEGVGEGEQETETGVFASGDGVVGQKEDIRPGAHEDYSRDFKLICDGLFVACAVCEELNEDALTLLKGLGSHMFYTILCNQANITKIDREGHPILQDSSDIVRYNSQNHLSDGKLQPLRPFGSFRLSGSLAGTAIDPFVFNEALADALADAHMKNSHVAAMAVMNHVVGLFHKIKDDGLKTKESSPHEENAAAVSTGGFLAAAESTSWGGDALLENLLCKLCSSCFSQPWNHRAGVMAGLFELITKMGHPWSSQYEVELVHTAMFLLKDTPDGIAYASEDSIRFFLQVSWLFFGGPSSWKGSNPSPLIHDVMCPTTSNTRSSSGTPVAAEETGTSPTEVKKASLTLILSEIASTRPLVR